MNFLVNGRKIYLKGGNWGMSEYLLRCHGKEYETKIKLHKDMNYNIIRTWTGCVTDDEFYDYCDKYGIMVWEDFWLYVAYNDVANDDDFITNATDKVKRLRNHPCIALWCGANETHPQPALDDRLRAIIAQEDHNDRMYKSSSNQDGLSGSGWWGNQPPRHHFETSGSNLAWNKPAYPYGIDYGYGMRSEIGMATFPNFESVKQFIPANQWWPLPSDEALKNADSTVWNRHFFGKEASNANPVKYKTSVDTQFGVSKNLEAFCEKAQYLNVEVMKGMYEAWNDKMWNDAAGLIIWMSQSAYPSFVWQTYDYYYDATGAYWGAKKACEPVHIQWNAANNTVKVINSTLSEIKDLTATATIYNLKGKALPAYASAANVDVAAGNIKEAFKLNLDNAHFDDYTPGRLSALHFIKLELKDGKGNVLAENFYWRNGLKELDYTALNDLPSATISLELKEKQAVADSGRLTVMIANHSQTVAFGNRIRLVDKKTKARILPVIMSDNYFTLMPGERKWITIEATAGQLANGADILLKQYGYTEQKKLSVSFK